MEDRSFPGLLEGRHHFFGVESVMIMTVVLDDYHFAK